MKNYKAPEMEKLEYKSEDVLTDSSVDNKTVSDINDLLKEPSAP